MLKSCCFCVSLEVGCYIVAGFFLLMQLLSTYSYASLLPYLEPDEREDKENRDIRERIKTKHIIWIVVNVLFCIIGLCIFVAIYLKNPLMLKVLAVLIVVPCVVNIVMMPFDGIPPSGITVFSSLVSLAIFVYCALVLWSYAVEIENPDEPTVVYLNSSYRDYQQAMADQNQRFNPYSNQQQFPHNPQQPNQPFGYRHWQGQPYGGPSYNPQPNYYAQQTNPPYPNQPNRPYPSQQNPSFPTQVNRSYLSQPNPANPTQLNSPNPTQPNPQSYAQSNSLNPTQPNPTQPTPRSPNQFKPPYPTQPNSLNPTQPNLPNPTQPTPRSPNQFNPPYPTQFNPPHPTQPNSRIPTQPNPRMSLQQDSRSTTQLKQ